MDDLGMSYAYSETDQNKDKWMAYQDEYVLREIGGKFLSELLSSPNPFTARLTRTDEPSGYAQRTVTYRLHVKPVQTINIREVEIENLPTRAIALSYKKELIRRFKRFIRRSFHG